MNLPWVAAWVAMALVNGEPAISPALADLMVRKLALIEEQGERSNGSPVTTILGEAEINSYFEYRMGPKIPRGVSGVRFDLHPERAVTTCSVDFDQVKAASRRPVHPLLNLFLNGRKPVSVQSRFTSSNGSGLFQLEEVTIGNIVLRGVLLDLVVRNFVQPRYPRAAINRPFALPAQIDRVVVEEGRVVVHQK